MNASLLVKVGGMIEIARNLMPEEKIEALSFLMAEAAEKALDDEAENALEITNRRTFGWASTSLDTMIDGIRKDMLEEEMESIEFKQARDDEKYQTMRNS